MSRHRLIRNLTADDIDTFDDSLDPELDACVQDLRALVGPDYDRYELEETLLYYEYDLTKSVNWLLDGIDSDGQDKPIKKKSIPAQSLQTPRPIIYESRSQPSTRKEMFPVFSSNSSAHSEVANNPAAPSAIGDQRPIHQNLTCDGQTQSLLAGSSLLLGLLSAPKTTPPLTFRPDATFHNRFSTQLATGGLGTLLETCSKAQNPASSSRHSTLATCSQDVYKSSISHATPRASPDVQININDLALSPHYNTPFCRVLSSRIHPTHQLDSFRVLPLTIFSSYPSCFYPKPSFMTKIITPFSFSSPSPDDLVLSAQIQSKNTSQKKSHQKTKDVTPKSFNSTAKPISNQIKTSPSSVLVVDNVAASVSELGLGEPKLVQLPIPPKKRVDIIAEAAKRPTHLNIVIVGHVDAGKSTLTGHLLLQLGKIDAATMHGYKRDSSKQGKSAFAYAWIMDQSSEERNRGVTIDVGVQRISSASNRIYTLLDAPGHRDFIPNMISGAAQADAAVLVVDAIHGEFEVGLNGGGQAREHMLLVKSLGISHVIVAVNKMDAADVQWSYARYEEIKETLSALFSSLGYNCKEAITFVPTSGLSGSNLTTRMDRSECEWYDGMPSLLEVLESVPSPVRPITKPFRMQVSDFAKGGAASGSVSVWGHIDAGSIQIGDIVLLMPLGEEAVVRAIECDSKEVKWAMAGDDVMVSLSGPDVKQLSTGLVLSDKLAPIPVTNRFEAKVIVFEPKVPITLGYPVILHQGGLNETAVITKMHAVLDKTDGKVIKKKPRVLTKGVTASIEISTDRPICLESFLDSKKFGRFMLRKGGETLAAGIVSQVITVYQPAAMRASMKTESPWSINGATVP